MRRSAVRVAAERAERPAVRRPRSCTMTDSTNSAASSARHRAGRGRAIAVRAWTHRPPGWRTTGRCRRPGRRRRRCCGARTASRSACSVSQRPHGDARRVDADARCAAASARFDDGAAALGGAACCVASSRCHAWPSGASCAFALAASRTRSTVVAARQRPHDLAVDPDLRRVVAGAVALAEVQAELVVGACSRPGRSRASSPAPVRTSAPPLMKQAGPLHQEIVVSGGGVCAKLRVEGDGPVDARLRQAQVLRDRRDRRLRHVAVAMLDAVQRLEQVALARRQALEQAADLEGRLGRAGRRRSSWSSRGQYTNGAELGKGGRCPGIRQSATAAGQRGAASRKGSTMKSPIIDRVDVAEEVVSAGRRRREGLRCHAWTRAGLAVGQAGRAEGQIVLYVPSLLVKTAVTWAPARARTSVLSKETF